MAAKPNIRLAICIIFILFLDTVVFSMDQLNYEIEIDKAHTLYKNNNLLIFDVRTENEWNMTGVIPNSILISMHDNNNQERKGFLKELKKALSSYNNQNLAFICASGARSKIVADYLIQKGYKNIYHIPDGILGKQNNGWLFKGFPIMSYKKGN